MQTSRKGNSQPPKQLTRPASSNGKIVASLDKSAPSVPGASSQVKESLGVQKFIIGCSYTAFVALFQGLLFNIVKRSATPTFYAPAFVIWFRCLFRVFTFPIYTLLRWKVFRRRGEGSSGDSLHTIIRDGQKLYGDQQGPTAKFWCDMLFLMPLMIGSQWLSFLPLFGAQEPGALASMSTISFPMSFFVMAFSFNTPLPNAKLSASTINLAGISVLSLLEISINPRWQEVLVVLVGGFFTGALQVGFRAKFRGRGGLASLYFYVSLAALLMFLLMWPLVMYLKWTGIEYWEIHQLPWKNLIVTSTLAMLVISIVNAAVVHLPQMFTSLHMLLLAPCAYGWEKYLTGREVSSLEMGGAVMAIAGALWLILSDVDLQTMRRKLAGTVTPWTQMLMTFTGMGVKAKRQKQKRL